MPFRLLPLHSKHPVLPLSISQIFQNAAGHAWTRRCKALTKRKLHSTPVEVLTAFKAQCLDTRQKPQEPSRARRILFHENIHRRPKPVSNSVTYFNPSLNDVDSVIPETDPSLDDEFDFHLVLGDIKPSVLSHLLTTIPVASLNHRSHHYLPTPTSRSTLLRNCRYFLNACHPPAPYPALLDYHALYPQFHSTRSFNLLIEMGLHHRQYGAVQALFSDFREQALPRNIETYKLEVRWLVHIGHWKKAWSYLMSIRNEISQTKGTIPFPLWLELCYVNDRAEASLSKVPHQRLRQQTEHAATLVTEPDYPARYEILQQHPPTPLYPPSKLSPFAAVTIIRLMLRAGHQARALTLTRDILNGLPRTISQKRSNMFLDLIHCQMAASNAKPGLPKFILNRQMLTSLLKLHPSLKPTSHTLHLLLAPLRHAKRCGTIAWQTLHFFKSKWGPHVESRVVRRRICILALKEGRLDIFRRLSRVELTLRRGRHKYLNQIYPLRLMGWNSAAALHRLPMRKLFPRNGREGRLWHRLKARAHQQRVK